MPGSKARILTFLLIALAVGGCVSEPDAPPPEPTPVAPAPSIPKATLYTLLDAADAALADDHLLTPRAGSAYSYYQEILALDPTQEDAQRGLERIVERYVAMSRSALARRQFATARSMLDRARLVLPEHPSIEPSAAQIRLIMEADRAVLRVDPGALADQTLALAASLRSFARADCRYTIYAASDAQGRWMYRMLNEGLSEARVRAQLNIRTPPIVERLCFES